MADELVAGAAEMAFKMLGWPEDDMTAALAQVQEELRASLARQLGEKIASIIARAFVRTVTRHRSELQTAGFHSYGDNVQ
jgi:hypothetical protein